VPEVEADEKSAKRCRLEHPEASSSSDDDSSGEAMLRSVAVDSATILCNATAAAAAAIKHIVPVNPEDSVVPTGCGPAKKKKKKIKSKKSRKEGGDEARECSNKAELPSSPRS
jgi:threonine synthase